MSMNKILIVFTTTAFFSISSIASSALVTQRQEGLFDGMWRIVYRGQCDSGGTFIVYSDIGQYVYQGPAGSGRDSTSQIHAIQKACGREELVRGPAH